MALRNFTGRTSATDDDEPAGTSPETHINEGCEFVGELRFKEKVRIDGRVEGEIWAAKSVVIGESAIIEAGIRAECVEIYGVVKGDIRVERKTTLHKSARVTGEIHTAGIVVEEGARFKGCIVIGEPEASTDSVEKKAAKPAAGTRDKDGLAA